MISPAQVPSTGRPAATKSRMRLLEAVGLELDAHRRALPAGDHEAVEAVELAGRAHLDGARAEPLERGAVGLEVALDGEHPDAGRAALVGAGGGRRLDATSHGAGAGCPRRAP